MFLQHISPSLHIITWGLKVGTAVIWLVLKLRFVNNASHRLRFHVSFKFPSLCVVQKITLVRSGLARECLALLPLRCLGEQTELFSYRDVKFLAGKSFLCLSDYSLDTKWLHPWGKEPQWKVAVYKYKLNS